MPKYGIHHIVLSDAVARLKADASAAAARDAGNILEENKGIAMIGAIGPDLLFFAPDYEEFNKAYRLYRNIKDVIDQYNRVTQPIRDINRAITTDIPLDTVVGGLADRPDTARLIRMVLERLDETVNLFKTAISTGLFAGVLEGADLLAEAASVPRLSSSFFERFFTPPLQNNEPVRKWYWFDMLHYRNTGDFGRNLVSFAATPQQRAYAYGYLSHIATDLIGHAFVNQIVGGPYRMHVQRHVTVENFMDCKIFDERYHKNINSILLEKLALPETLPREIGDLIYQALLNTYWNVEHPRLIHNDASTPREERGFLKREQIDETYRIFYEVLQIMRDMNVNPPEEPFSDVADVLAEAWRRITSRPPPSPPSFAGTGACSLGDILSFGTTARSRECYENFFNNVGRFFAYLGEFFAWAFDTLRRFIDFLLTALESLPISILLAVLYGIQLIIYEIYQTARSALSLAGFIFPDPTDINSSHGRNLTTTFQCRLEPFQYPKQSTSARSHLICPLPNVENPGTMPDFNPSGDDPGAVTTTPNEFITNLPFNLENLRAYSNSASPEETRRLHDRRTRIGNATDLSAWMITIANDAGESPELKSIAFTNWNLDSDRGYGYKTWTGLIPAESGGRVVTRDSVTGGRLREDMWRLDSPVEDVIERLTDFRPDRHGFNFSNAFVNNVIFDIKTKGRCGGMAYASLDYYFADRPIPTYGPPHPPDEHPLAEYIYGRLFDSFTAPRAVNYPRWTLASTDEVTRWTKEDEFFRLRNYIDNGMPVPLGLIKATNLLEIGNENHQVVAFGYRFDRNSESMQVFTYDNNFPRQVAILDSDPSRAGFEEFVIEDDGSWTLKETYRGFFVHSYQFIDPPPDLG
jgi:hypothetical protein